MNNVSSTFLHKGGLAEIVTQPTDITYSFLLHWFSGTGALGHAWKLLDLPFDPLPVSVLVRKENELYVDLQHEEELLYKNTILRYAPLSSSFDQPKQRISIKKLFHPLHLLPTLKIILLQSQWIGNSDTAMKKAQFFFDSIPKINDSLSLEVLDTTITEQVLPYALAIDYFHEFFLALLLHKVRNEREDILSYIYQEAKKKDWIFQSIQDQYKVKTGEVSFSDFLSLYGMRSDDDYELTLPRWYEIPDEMKKRIEHSFPEKQTSIITSSNKHEKLINTVTMCSFLRTESRKKILPWIDTLRKKLKQKISDNDALKKTTRKDFGLAEPITFSTEKIQHHEIHTDPLFGNGIGVSPGITNGIVKNIKTTSDSIPDSCIAIFPNASPMFASLYSQCKGIIFLSGGRTSHGVIVSREYGIPAIIAPHTHISDGALIELDGTNGIIHISMHR